MKKCYSDNRTARLVAPIIRLLACILKYHLVLLKWPIHVLSSNGWHGFVTWCIRTTKLEDHCIIVCIPRILVSEINRLLQTGHIDEVRCVFHALFLLSGLPEYKQIPLKGILQRTVNGSLKTFAALFTQPKVHNSCFETLPIYLGALFLDAFRSKNADVFKACLSNLTKIRSKEKRQGYTYLFYNSLKGAMTLPAVNEYTSIRILRLLLWIWCNREKYCGRVRARINSVTYYSYRSNAIGICAVKKLSAR